MPNECLLAGGLGTRQIAVRSGKVGTAARAGRQRPWAPERSPLRLKLLGVSRCTR
jgi:hypothetical protein